MCARSRVKGEEIAIADSLKDEIADRDEVSGIGRAGDLVYQTWRPLTGSYATTVALGVTPVFPVATRSRADQGSTLGTDI